ncbi:shikimate dehydrogenase [Algoriphagus sp. NF]|uniref:shikimate dehydrogenase family protein n=1 Tax=Algoriphagus sp. NF TaxID=2992756 RepID=UPI00237BEB17|nr:shikimate dehydrogenase [Algoriphagus sp. NF]MDE0559455.1 shikimate dehydrogenase [Algoriphagus sp. NF]
MRKFGLIGFPLGHSFSKKYFTEKFQKEGLDDCQFELFEIETADQLKKIVAENPSLEGLSVTIPHKQAVIPLLNDLDPACAAIGAVNCIQIKDGKLIGYNTDYIGFKDSLEAWLEGKNVSAIVLGTGGASKAVSKALEDLEIESLSVSRKTTDSSISYEELAGKPEFFEKYRLIINCTPLGTFPNTDAMPSISKEAFTKNTLVYDLVYNPAVTKLMQTCLDKGGKAKNGLEMLEGQAEAAWKIWNS